MTEKGSMIELT